MKMHCLQLFVDKDESLHVYMHDLEGYSQTKTIGINAATVPYIAPRVVFFVEGDEALIAFKNAVLWAFDSYERSKKNAKDI